MTHTYKDIDFIVAINEYTDNATYIYYFKDGTNKRYNNEPKYSDKFYENHTRFDIDTDVTIYVRFVPAWIERWTKGETTEQYYKRAQTIGQTVAYRMYLNSVGAMR